MFLIMMDYFSIGTAFIYKMITRQLQIIRKQLVNTNLNKPNKIQNQ